MRIRIKVSGSGHLGEKGPGTARNAGADMQQIPIWIAIIACILSVAPATVRAEEGNIHIGQLRIHPFVSASETFSDNVYYTSTEEKRDSIITYSPGIKLQLPFGKHQVEAQYYAVANRHRTYNGEDTTNHIASGLLDFKIGTPFELRLSDVFTKGHEPRSSSATGFIEVFRNNIATASASYKLLGRSKIQFDAGKSTWDFVQSPFRNRYERFYAGYLYYRFLPKTSVFVEFDRNKVVYDDPSLDLDSVADSELIGLTWEITEKSKGTIKGGRVQKDFKSPSQGNFRGWTSAADLHHEFSQDTSLTIAGQRTVNETNVLGARFFVTTGVSGELTQRLFHRLSAVARGSYGVDDFSDPVPPDTIVRQDKTAMGGGGLKYSLWDWLEIAADYSYRDRQSNIPANDYRVHEYMVSARAAL